MNITYIIVFKNQIVKRKKNRNTHTVSAHGPLGQNDLFPRYETAFPDCQLDESKTSKNG